VGTSFPGWVMPRRPAGSAVRCTLVRWATVAIAAAAVPTALAQSPTDTGNALTQIQLLRERQDILVEGANRAVSNLQISLVGIGAIFTTLAGFWTYRQVRDDRHRIQVEAQSLQQIQAMATSYTGNIASINALINALSRTLSFQDKITRSLDDRAKSIDEHLQRLEEDRIKRDNASTVQAACINERAALMFVRCGIERKNRGLFKSTDIRDDLHVLGQQVDTFENLGEAANVLSPIAFFLRGLDRFNAMLYDDAVRDSARSRDNARAQIDDPLPQYGTWGHEERVSKLQALLDEIHYHSGIVHYNLGDYSSALDEFQEAFERNPLDFRSRYYIPEIMFFKSDPGQAAADATAREFGKAEDEMKDLSTEQRNRLDPEWHVLYTQLKMRMGNFYVPKPSIALQRTKPWEKYEDATTAIDHYYEAYLADPANPFVKFSLALAMALDNRPSRWRNLNPGTLFAEVFKEMRATVFTRTEPIVACLLYYSMALCVLYGHLAGENALALLMSSRQQLQRVPSRISNRGKNVGASDFLLAPARGGRFSTGMCHHPVLCPN
jgi:tetratricopeptide (TPR) repeat protein